jgi:hypothetical protein
VVDRLVRERPAEADVALPLVSVDRRTRLHGL